MKSVGIKALKNQLSKYVRLAAAGETILVTDRDEVVAELIAPRQTRSPLLSDAMLADAVRKGWIVPPSMSSKTPPESRPVAKLSAILDELGSDREER